MSPRNPTPSLTVPWINLTRFAAIVSVILFHASAAHIDQFEILDVSQWIFVDIYASITRICVPLFFMISGSLLLSKEDGIISFYKRRLVKIFIPLMIWSLAYIVWKDIVGKEVLTSTSIIISILKPAYYHLWFLYAIVGIYLYMPLLQVLVQHSDRRRLYYFVGLWFIATSLIPSSERLSELHSHIDLGMAGGFSGYLVLGHLLRGSQITVKRVWMAISLFLLCNIATAEGLHIFTSRGSINLARAFHSYLAPNVIGASMAAFYLLKCIGTRLTKSESGIYKTIDQVTPYIFGIYLVHAMIQYHVHELKIPIVSNGHLGYALLLETILVFYLSFVCVWIIKKIPLIRVCVP